MTRPYVISSFSYLCHMINLCLICDIEKMYDIGGSSGCPLGTFSLLSFTWFWSKRTLLRDLAGFLVPAAPSTRRYISTFCIGVQRFEQVSQKSNSNSSSTSPTSISTPRLAKNAALAQGLKAFPLRWDTPPLGGVGNVSASQWDPTNAFFPLPRE